MESKYQIRINVIVLIAICLNFDVHTFFIKENSTLDILQIAKQLNATEFLKLVNISGLTKNFTQKGPITVFVPSNEAFKNLPEEQKNNLKDVSYLKQILLYHIIHGHHSKASFHNEAIHKTESIIEGSDQAMDVRINIYHHGEIISVSGSQIISFDHNASNGVVHILSRVMFMLPVFGTVAQVTSFPITRYMAYGIMDGGLQNILITKQPHTLFAPTDNFFEALPNKTFNILRGNKTAIRRLMENHIVPGTYFTSDLRQGDTLTTLLGETLTVEIKPGNVTVDGAYFSIPDFIATNGVVHFSTKIFWPSDWNFE